MDKLTRELIINNIVGRAMFTEDLSHSKVSNRNIVHCSEAGLTGLACPMATAQLHFQPSAGKKNIRQKLLTVHTYFHKNHFPLLWYVIECL